MGATLDWAVMVVGRVALRRDEGHQMAWSWAQKAGEVGRMVGSIDATLGWAVMTGDWMDSR